MNFKNQKSKIFRDLLILLLVTFISINSTSQDLKIYEIQSENYSTIYDIDGDASDWFELINAGEETLSLNGYGITDDQNPDSAWIFPDYLLDPGEIVFVFASGKDRNSDLAYWHSPIIQGDILKYKIPESEIEGWKNIDFDDSLWGKGPSGFGYGDNDDATIISNTNSVYIRAEFSIENPDNVFNAILHMDYDDGFVAYLNGEIIARSANMGSPDEIPVFNANPNFQHEAVMYSGNDPEAFPLSNFNEIFVEGKNVLAIQVHNISASSTDFTAIPFFSVLLNYQPENLRRAYFLPIPDDFHTNFKLNSDNDSLFLYSPNKELIDQLFFESPGGDISIGYTGQNFSELKAFLNPTPKSLNTEEGYNFTSLPEVIINTESGLYSGNITINLSVEGEENEIYYTTNGQPPTLSSSLYQGPFTLVNAATIQARVIKENYMPGKISTKSFYPNYNKTLPVTYITTKPEYLWDENIGIYATGNNAEPDNPHFGANYWMDWERPAKVEMFFPNGENNFSINGGIKIYGAWSRAHAQKSLAVFARKEYGNKSIQAKLFDDRENDEFEALVYRNSGNDWFAGSSSSGTYYRDLLITKIGNKHGVDVMAGRPTIMYLNGEYWGIQNLREKINEHFIADNHHEEPDKVDILEKNLEIIEGSSDDYSNMLNFLENNDIAVQENYDYICTQMDIQEFIYYNIIQIYIYNGDWPGNNMKYWRPQRENGKWRWILFDTDFGFGLYNQEKVYHETMYFATAANGPEWPNPPWATYLLRSLLQNPTFKNQFINTFADLLNTSLLPNNVISMINERINEIDSEIPSHTEKWSGNYQRWQENNDILKSFASIRPEVLWSHLNAFFGLNETKNLKITVQGTNNALIKLNSILLDDFPWNGKYFNNIPVKLTAIPPEGYRFVRWDGAVYSNSPQITVNMNTNQSANAVFEAYQPGETKGIIINEISYKALKSEDSEDWVELYNNSSQYIDISGWIIQDSDITHQYKIPQNTIMAPGEYLVIARDMYEFSEIHPTVYNVMGPLGFGFSGAGECIYLYNKQNVLRDQVCYANEYPWPEEANGEGYTLSLSDPDKDNMMGSNWNNSPILNGTPGRENSIPTLVKEFNNDPLKITLLDCFPNPFDSKINIPVIINSVENVKIDIYNINGQLVKNIFEGKMNNDLHNLTWDAEDQKSGIYIVRLQSNYGIQVKKVIKK